MESEQHCTTTLRNLDEDDVGGACWGVGEEEGRLTRRTNWRGDGAVGASVSVEGRGDRREWQQGKKCDSDSEGGFGDDAGEGALD